MLKLGYTVEEIGRKLYPNHKRKAAITKQQAHRILATDKEIQQILAEESKGILIQSTSSAATALAMRAKRGRVDAARLIFEASGFHNPRVDHEHSGEIKISLDIPRPARPEVGDGKQEEAVDAEVVEE